MTHRCAAASLVCIAFAAVSAHASSIGDLFKRVQNSVVVIEIEQEDQDPSFPGQVVTVEGLGSGVLISNEGKIVTAAHVVQVANRINVHFHSGETIPARILASEPGADLALLQLQRKPAMAQVAPLGDSDEAEVGDQIFIVGAPLGMSHTLTVGHISAKRREDTVFGGTVATELFQTDAAINQGNSGGPMFNLDGEVIGIVSYIISQSGGHEGLGFAVTSNMARSLLVEQRSLWSGIQGRMVEGDLAAILNVPQSKGLLVELVAARSPGSHMGLRPGTTVATIHDEQIIVGGDVILEVMGVSLDAADEEREQMRERLNNLTKGDEIRIKVLRNGQVVELMNYFFPDSLPSSVPEKE